jgi:hypothetical protein
LLHASIVGDVAIRVRTALRTYAAVVVAAGVALAAGADLAGTSSIGPILLVMVAPAVLVWFQPTPRSIAVWTAIAWFSALMLVLGKDHHGAIIDWVDIFMTALLATLPIAGFGAAALSAERMVGEPSSLARKLRSIAAVTFLLAGGLAAVGFLPGETIRTHTMPAGGLPLVILLAVAIAPGLPVYVHPTRARGWRWTFYGLGLALPGAVTLSLAFDPGTWERVAIAWPRRVVELGVGTLLAMLLVVLPTILLFARGDDDPSPATLPPARLR